MTLRTLMRRVADVEKTQEAKVECRYICRPIGLSDEDYPAWHAEQTADFPPGCRVMVVQFVSANKV
jgi:hypothetical protein